MPLSPSCARAAAPSVLRFDVCQTARSIDQPGPPAPADDGWYSYLQLAAMFNLPATALRKRLYRWHHDNDHGWKEVVEPRMHEPRYLYQLSAVRRVLAGVIHDHTPMRADDVLPLPAASSRTAA